MRRVPYRLPELLEAADGGGTVYVVEGEKDAETLCRFGLVATTNAGGASWKWTDEWATEYFRGLGRVVVIADNDEPGKRAARDRAQAIRSVVSDVRLIECLPDVGDHGDVSDYLADGGTLEALLRIAEESEQVEPAKPIATEAPDAKSAKTSAADELLAYCEELRADGSLELFKDLAGDPFASLGAPQFPGLRTYPLGDQSFARQVKGSYFFAQRGLRHGRRKALSSATWKDALGTLEAIACFEGNEHPVYLRSAGLPDRVILDLGDDTGRVVVVNAEGWTVDSPPPVRFRRPRAMQALPEPCGGGDIAMLGRYVNVSDEGMPALLAWLITAMSGTGPYPVLVLHGEQGSAKSTTARICRELIDPALSPLRQLPHDERDLAVACHNNQVLAFDNLSGIEPKMSDALCRTASGEGFATRTLYENHDEQVFAGARPIILTGIAEAASRPDLLDRSLLVEAPRIAEGQRADARELFEAFERDRPALLGVLLDGLSSALAHRSSVVLERSPRMADAARLSIAAEPGLGLTPGTMASAWEVATESAHSVALDASALAQAISAFFRDNGPWEGSAGELLLRLNERLGDRPPRAWPNSPRQLSSELKRVAPNLRAAGIPVEHLGPTGRDRSRHWRVGPATAFSEPEQLGL